MRVLLMLVCGVMMGVTAKPSLYHGYVPATYSTYYPYSLSSQYHAQDELGQYSYGYSGDTSAKHETKTLDGVTRGGYSYIDANGIVQTVNYVSDPVYGFRVAATNLPRDPAPVVAAAAAAPVLVPQTVVVDTPAVAAAKASHLATVEAAAAQAAAAQAAAVAQVATVQTVTAAPVVVSQPVVVDTAAVAAAKAAHLATVQAANARAAAAQVAAAHAVAPLPVTETPEVQRAKAEHLAAVQKAAAEAAAAPDYSEVAPLAPVVSAAPLTATYYSAPLVYGYGAGYPLAAAAARYSYVPVAHTSYSALTPLSSQYHAQDELGQYSYGYAGGPSAKHETRTLDGVTRGSYSYIDANGIVQTVNYVADDVFGFRVAATNLPVAPGAH